MARPTPLSGERTSRARRALPPFVFAIAIGCQPAPVVSPGGVSAPGPAASTAKGSRAAGPEVTAEAAPPPAEPGVSANTEPDAAPLPPSCPEHEFKYSAGGRHVLLRTRGGPAVAPYDCNVIDTIAIDGVRLYPPDCVDGPRASTRPLCSRAHRRFRGDMSAPPWLWSDGKGAQLTIVSERQSATAYDALVQAIISGSSECSAYGYWVLRVDAHGARVTEPVIDCFFRARRPDEAYQGEPAEPVIRWGPPLTFRASKPSGNGTDFRTLRLDERSFVLRQIASGHRP